MKTHIKLLVTALALVTLHLSPFTFRLHAAVPTEWTVRVGPRSAAYQAERRHGDALALKASLVYNGQPLAYSGPARLYAQTNGMGAAWWDLAPCTVSSNVLQATWLPSFDTGADVVDLFLGGPSNYQAAARIRFLPSPGSVPNSLPLPAPTLDFATVQILNPPYYTRQETDSAIESAAPGDYSTVSNRAMSAIQEHQSLEPSTNYTDRTLGSFAATGTVARALYASSSGDAATADRALSIGTPTRWTDATGCVWQVDFVFQQVIFILGDPYELSYSAIPNQISWYDSEFLHRVYYNTLNHEWGYSDSSASWTNKQEIVLGQQTITLYDEFGDEDPISFDLTYAPNTNLVGRVALTNDLPGAITSTISDFASTGTVHAAESSTYSSRLFDASYDAAYDATYLIRESTNAAVAVAAAKQDALPYPTNAIPYAAISGAPSGGGQEWRVVNYDVEVDAISFVTNGMAIMTFLNSGYAYGISVSTNGWPDGASMFVRGSFRAGATYTIPYDLRLIGYGTWPTNNFQSVWWRSGTNIFVNVLLEE